MVEVPLRVYSLTELVGLLFSAFNTLIFHYLFATLGTIAYIHAYMCCVEGGVCREQH